MFIVDSDSVTLSVMSFLFFPGPVKVWIVLLDGCVYSLDLLVFSFFFLALIRQACGSPIVSDILYSNLIFFFFLMKFKREHILPMY